MFGAFIWFELSYDLMLGVDFKIKMLTVGGKRLKLTIWDTGKVNLLFNPASIMWFKQIVLINVESLVWLLTKLTNLNGLLTYKITLD